MADLPQSSTNGGETIMNERELIIKALRIAAGTRLVELMNEGMTSVEGNQFRRDADELADRLEADPTEGDPS